MKKILPMAFLLSAGMGLQATNYYLSSSTGLDSRPTNNTPATAWKTLAKFNTSGAPLLVAGDSVLFKYGDTFTGELLITKSGSSAARIVYAPYGTPTGTPNITGYTTLTSWTLTSTGIYESYCASCGSTLNSVTLNGTSQEKGRYPNSNAANGGYLNFESHNAKTSITDNQLSGSPSWSGAELVLRSKRWTLDRNLITSHSGTTINYTPWNVNAYEPTNNFGYFIQNSLSTLDKLGEWYYNPSTKKVYMYFGAGSPASYTVAVSTTNTFINMNNISYIDIRQLSMDQSNNAAVKMNNCSNIQLLWGQIFNSGESGISVANSSYIEIIGTLVNNSNYNGIEFTSNCNNNEISYNEINNSGVLTGMGDSGNDTGEGIHVNGTNNYIHRNIVNNTGYSGIAFYGTDNNVSYNFVNNFTKTKDDGGGIYTWTGSSDPTNYTNRKIEYNTVLNGIGAGYGTDASGYKPSYGIYLDDYSGNVSVRYNTVAHCGADGIYLHMAHDITLSYNTIYNTASQFRFGEDQSCCLIRNNVVTNNIAVAKTTSQQVATFTTYANDISSFGTFNNNYYCRPLDDKLTINSSFYNSGYNFLEQDLSMWQAYAGLDAASQKSPLKYYPFTINSSGAEKFSNGSFNNVSTGISVWAPSPGTITATRDATSKITGTYSASISYTNTTTDPAIASLDIGTVTSGNKYVLNFNLLGANNNKIVKVYLQQKNSPWAKLSEVSSCKISNAITANTFLFTATATDANAQIIYELDGQDGVIYLDDVSLKESTVTMTNPDDYIRFEYNETDAAKNISLTGTYKDVTNTSYSGTVSIPAYSSKIFLKVAGSYKLATGITDETTVKNFQIYPNPSDNFINIELVGMDAQASEIQVYDLSGRVVTAKPVSLTTGNQIIQMDVNHLQAGVYMVRLATSNGLYQQKFIKSN